MISIWVARLHIAFAHSYYVYGCHVNLHITSSSAEGLPHRQCQFACTVYMASIHTPRRFYFSAHFISIHHPTTPHIHQNIKYRVWFRANEQALMHITSLHSTQYITLMYYAYAKTQPDRRNIFSAFPIVSALVGFTFALAVGASRRLLQLQSPRHPFRSLSFRL